MTSRCVDVSAPAGERRRSRIVGSSISSLDPDWDALLAAASPADASGSAALGALVIPAPPTSGIGLLPPGVVDTRPHGHRLVDLTGGVALRDGVIDTRPLAVGTDLQMPPNPFEVDLTAPAVDCLRPAVDAPVATTPSLSPPTVPHSVPVEPRVVVDVDTLEVRRVVDHRPPVAAAATAPVAPAPTALAAPTGPPEAVPAPTRASRGAQAPSPYMRRSELRRLEARASKRSSSTLSVPQVGIASALGLATIAAPLSGALTAPGQAGANQLSSGTTISAAVVAAPEAVAPPNLRFPRTVPDAPNVVEAARVVVDDTKLTSVPQALTPPSRLLVTRADRSSGGRAVLPGCDGVVPASARSASNGRLPASALCTLWDRNEKLRADAAVAFAKLNVAYKQEFKKDICVTDSYRTLSEQYTVKSLRGGFAAAPGTSEHGWGLAVDLCGGSAVARTATFTWLRANAPRYGWDNPGWAQTTLYEPWHWEYVAGE